MCRFKKRTLFSLTYLTIDTCSYLNCNFYFLDKYSIVKIAPWKVCISDLIHLFSSVHLKILQRVELFIYSVDTIIDARFQYQWTPYFRLINLYLIRSPTLQSHISIIHFRLSKVNFLFYAIQRA